VTRAQKKKERALLLRQKLETSRTQRRIETRPFNLYVKHLDLSYTDEAFKNLFDEFGTISSSKVMRVKETGESKGFGFVCFSSQEEATNALTNMNGLFH
jgi:polyadenylate-binding protein